MVPKLSQTSLSRIVYCFPVSIYEDIACTAVCNLRFVCCSKSQVNPTSEKYSEAECILLDPSCSGSGMVTRMANLLEDTGSADESVLNNSTKND